MAPMKAPQGKAKAKAKAKALATAAPKAAPKVNKTKGLPKAFEKTTKGKGSENNMVDAALKKQRQQQRDASSFKWACNNMPAERKAEFDEIISDTSANKARRLKDFKAKWLVNRSWEGAGFKETVTEGWSHEDIDDKAWVTYGRLKALIGDDEAQLAIKGEWYPMKPGKKKGQLMIRYEEKKEVTTDKTGHDKSLQQTTKPLTDDVAQTVLTKLLQKQGKGSDLQLGKKEKTSKAASGASITDDALNALKRKPAGAMLALPDKPGAPAKKTKGRQAVEKAIDDQLASTNTATLNAYAQLTKAKGEMTIEKARLLRDAPKTSRGQRSAQNLQQDIDELLEAHQNFEQDLLERQANKLTRAHMEENIDVLYQVADHLSEVKDVMTASKKIKKAD